MKKLSKTQSQLNKIADGLVKDVQKKVKNATSEIAYELTHEAKSAIIAFYKDYDPLYYRRSYSMRYTYKRFYRNPHGKIYHGGVELVDAGDRKQHGTRDSEYIFNEVWMLGRHGRPEEFPHAIHNITPITSPPPWDVVLNKRDEIVKNIQSYLK